MSLRKKSFEMLPALRLRGRPLRSALRTVTIAWMFGVVWMSCISGSQMTLFGRLLGFSDMDFGIFGAVMYAATLAQLVASIIIERTGLRKYIFIYFACGQRLLWLAIAAVPLLLKPGRAAVATFMIIYGIGGVLAHVSTPAWQTWMGDMIPRRIRGRYLASRWLWTLPIQIVVVLVAGWVLDLTTVPGPMVAERQTLLLRTISVLFAVAAVFGTIDVLLFLRMREIVSPPLLNGRNGHRKRSLAGVVSGLREVAGAIADAFRDRVFRHYALYGATMAFGMIVGGQFFWLNSLENLGYSKLGANFVFLVCGAATSLLMARPWGKLIDRWGRRPVLILATIGVVFSPVGWLVIPPGSRLLAYLLGVASCALGGAFWSGINLAQIGVIWGFAETPGRSKYMAAAAVVAAAGGFAGGLAGGWLAQGLGYLQASPLQVGPFRWINYHFNFLASMVARAAALAWLIGMPDPHAKPFRDMMRQIRFNAYNNVMPRLFWPLRAAGQWWSQRRARQNGVQPPR